jgi:hypothetical protein
MTHLKRLKLNSSCFGVNKLLLQKPVQVCNSYIPMHSAGQVSVFRVDFSENYIPCRKRSILQILSTIYVIILIFSVAVATKNQWFLLFSVLAVVKILCDTATGAGDLRQQIICVVIFKGFSSLYLVLHAIMFFIETRNMTTH